MAKARKKIAAPYGLWPSPIAPADLARSARRFGLVQGDGAWVYWTEGRPQEKGRQALMRMRPGARAAEELLPAPWSARSRVHEYGGGEFLAAGDVVYFVNDADQDIYELPPGKLPRRLTNVPDLRFADFALDGARRRLLAIAERHRAGSHMPENLIVAVSLSGPARGTVTDIVTGRDFYASPRLSPDGSRLAFLAWDLPSMPWDEAELLVADLDAEGSPGRLRRIAGGDGAAASHPAFAADGSLTFITDANGTGRLAVLDGGTVRTFETEVGDYGRPMWTLASKPYAITDDGRILASAVGGGARSAAPGLAELRIADMACRLRPGFPQLDGMSWFEGGLAAVASAPDTGSSIMTFGEAKRTKSTVVRTSSDDTWRMISLPEPMRFANARGEDVHAFYYAPRNTEVAKPRGEKPPALVLAHGGPTSMANRSLSPRLQFYTSRGFAVLDVDYAGSTGYGRAYRERLDGQWGIADVEDCAAGARHLAAAGLADPGRIAIAGGSAGGYTTLMALATTDVFAAGSSHYGISDLTLLMEHTHKFESGYLHRLLGTTPKAWKMVCRARSPIHLVDDIRAPLILFQGLEDKVVPPEQSRLIADKLRRKGQTVELREFAGEGHGFRRAETIVAVIEAELAFLLRTFGLAGAGKPLRASGAPRRP